MLLVIVDLKSRIEAFPIGVLEEVDTVLTGLGFKKEVYSVTKPGKAYAVTYDGPNVEKNRIEDALRRVTEKNAIDVSVEVEESVKFP